MMHIEKLAEYILFMNGEVEMTAKTHAIPLFATKSGNTTSIYYRAISIKQGFPAHQRVLKFEHRTSFIVK